MFKSVAQGPRSVLASMGLISDLYFNEGSSLKRGNSIWRKRRRGRVLHSHEYLSLWGGKFEFNGSRIFYLWEFKFWLWF